MPSPIFRLPLPLTLALRYLKSTRKNALATFLSAVAVLGIGLGVAVLILALAMLSGFQRALKAQVLARTPEIEVRLPPGADLGAALAEIRALEGVHSAELVVAGRGWLLAAGRVEAVEVTGFETTVPRSFPGAAGRPAGLYVSESLAARWALEAGSVVEVVSPRSTLTPFGPQPRMRSLALGGLFSSSPTDERERIALPLATAESLFGPGRRAIEVETGELERALAVAPRIAAALPASAEVRTWQDLNRPLLFALALEKLVTFVSVALIVLVASLALVADLSLLIASKRPEIGILQACGASAGAVKGAFLALGGLLAGLGLGGGGALGVGLALLFEHGKMIRVPGGIYFVDHIPFWVRGQDLAGIVALTALSAALCSVYAARRVTELTPVEAMRR